MTCVEKMLRGVLVAISCSLMCVPAILEANQVKHVQKSVAPDGSVTYSDPPRVPPAPARAVEGQVPNQQPATMPSAEEVAKPSSSDEKAPVSRVVPDAAGCGTGRGVLWADEFEQDLGGWGRPLYHWGKENVTFARDAHVVGRIARVRFPAGSFDPANMKKMGRPYSGTGFKVRLLSPGVECVHFRYALRFSEDFQFVRGGKLPGVYGGKGNSGGEMPNGRDGFSARYMWLEKGSGTVYAYLPTSVKWGTSIGRNTLKFVPGQWHVIEQQVVLNTPGSSNGSIRLWQDGVLVSETFGLRFRDVPELKIDGVFFDTFFGGNDPSWAPTRDMQIEFGSFVLSEKYVGL